MVVYPKVADAVDAFWGSLRRAHLLNEECSSLLSATVAPGSLTSFERQDQPLGQGRKRVEEGAPHSGKHVRAREHVSLYREPVSNDMPRPLDAVPPREPPALNSVVPASVAVPLPVGLAVSDHRVWVAEQDERVMSLDAAGDVRARTRLPFSPDRIAVTAGRIWLTNNCGCASGKLALIDRRTGQTRSIRIGETPVALTATATTAWAATFGDSALWRVRGSSSR